MRAAWESETELEIKKFSEVRINWKPFPESNFLYLVNVYSSKKPIELMEECNASRNSLFSKIYFFMLNKQQGEIKYVHLGEYQIKCRCKL